jgi:hypothetical protein
MQPLSRIPKALTQAYGVFRTEVQALIPDYSPETVNTDGWEATQIAWQTLFPNITFPVLFAYRVGCPTALPTGTDLI